MTVNLIKLCVGCKSLTDLIAWQAERLETMRRARQTPELMHVTRSMPKRADEVLDGGSIYWVIDGWVAARQRLLELRPVLKNGLPHCGLIYAADMIAVDERPMRPFQGWRYLEPGDAPPDRRAHDGIPHDMPAKMRRELRELGLI